MISAFAAKLLAKPAFKIGLGVAALLAVIGLVLGALWYVDSVREEGFKAGAAEVKVEVQTQTIIVKEKIQRAEDSAPRTPAGVSKRMREGTF